jgi:hypothetical protein
MTYRKSLKTLTILSTKPVCPIKVEPKEEPEPEIDPASSLAPKSFYSVPAKPKTSVISVLGPTVTAPKPSARKSGAGRKKGSTKSPTSKTVEHSIRKPAKVKSSTKKTVSKKRPKKSPKVPRTKTSK